MRRRMGTAALDMEAASDGSWQAQWRATVAARLPSQLWPDRTVLITAVDAQTGERSRSTVIAESTWPTPSPPALPVAFPRIGDNRYIDGGYRSNAENADLAAGYGRVLVLSPFGGRALTPVGWGMHLATQVDVLRTRGSRVETIFPDSSSEHMFGTNAMDLSLRRPAARAGSDQGTGPIRAAHKILALTPSNHREEPLPRRNYSCVYLGDVGALSGVASQSRPPHGRCARWVSPIGRQGMPGEIRSTPPVTPPRSAEPPYAAVSYHWRGGVAPPWVPGEASGSWWWAAENAPIYSAQFGPGSSARSGMSDGADVGGVPWGVVRCRTGAQGHERRWRWPSNGGSRGQDDRVRRALVELALGATAGGG